MKYIIFTLIVLIAFPGDKAQQLDPAQFHEYRTNLSNSFLKFELEKKGRVVFLGGSITHNPGWRDSICSYLTELFPETKFDFINAGIPSMGSTPGAFRFDRDVLKNGKVDLIFEEAAVNDDTNRRTPDEIIRAMEGIVRHARRSNPSCDLVFMYFADPPKLNDYKAGNTPQIIQLHEKVAEHYGISAINLAKEVYSRIEAGEFDWENDFRNLHPSPFGQNIYYRSISAFLEANRKEATDITTLYSLPKPIDEYAYSKGVMIAPDPPRPVKGWTMVEHWKPEIEASTRKNYVDVPMLVGSYPGKIIKFSFKGNAVGIAVAAGPDAGIIEYSIDNSEWMKRDLFQPWSRNLYLPWYYTLGSGLKNKKHILQIRMSDEKNPDSQGNKCIIRYFYFNEAEM